MPAKGQRRKQQIIDATKEMFMKNGYQSTHIGQVCDELNIARGTVYQYFGNKREILFAILEGVEEQFDDIFDVDDLEEYLQGKPGKDSVKKFIMTRMSACIKALLSEPIVIKLMFKEIAGIDDEVVQSVNEFVDYVTKTLIRDFDTLRDRGVYKKNLDSVIAAQMLTGGVLMILHHYESAENSFPGMDVIEVVTENFLFGVM